MRTLSGQAKYWPLTMGRPTILDGNQILASLWRLISAPKFGWAMIRQGRQWPATKRALGNLHPGYHFSALLFSQPFLSLISHVTKHDCLGL